jgi:hypothetical protein
MIFIISTRDSTRLSNSYVLKKKFFSHDTRGAPSQKMVKIVFWSIKSKNMIKDAPLFQPAGKKSTLRWGMDMTLSTLVLFSQKLTSDSDSST